MNEAVNYKVEMITNDEYDKVSFIRSIPYGNEKRIIVDRAIVDMSLVDDMDMIKVFKVLKYINSNNLDVVVLHKNIYFSVVLNTITYVFALRMSRADDDIFVAKVIARDYNEMYPWDEECDENYKKQWTDQDDYDNKIILAWNNSGADGVKDITHNICDYPQLHYTYVTTDSKNNPVSVTDIWLTRTRRSVYITLVPDITNDIVDDIFDYIARNDLNHISKDDNYEDKYFAMKEDDKYSYILKVTKVPNDWILYKLIIPDGNGKYPWDEDCDDFYKEQWTEKDEEASRLLKK